MADYIEQLITQLEQYQYSEDPQNVIAAIDLLVAALQEIEDAISGGGGGTGGVKKITAAMSPYTVAKTDHILNCDATGGAIVLIYGSGLTNPIEVAKIDASANTISITPDGSTVRAVLAQAAVGGQVQLKYVYSDGTTVWAGE